MFLCEIVDLFELPTTFNLPLIVKHLHLLESLEWTNIICHLLLQYGIASALFYSYLSWIISSIIHYYIFFLLCHQKQEIISRLIWVGVYSKKIIVRFRIFVHDSIITLHRTLCFPMRQTCMFQIELYKKRLSIKICR